MEVPKFLARNQNDGGGGILKSRVKLILFAVPSTYVGKTDKDTEQNDTVIEAWLEPGLGSRSTPTNVAWDQLLNLPKPHFLICKMGVTPVSSLQGSRGK